MNIRIIVAFLAALICITMAVPAMAQTSPFVITGHVSDSDNNPCNGAWVQVTNTNTSENWDAENDPESNYYKLILDSEDMNIGNLLQIEASGCTKIKIVEHTVTQSEMGDGGINDFDIVFDAPQEIIWQGDITLINGTTFDKTAHNSGVSYEINRTTALGALDAAAEEGIFNYIISDEYYLSWGSLFVDSIADIPNEGYNGWMYWVNYPEEPMPMVSAEQFVLEDGDVVTWYWSSSMEMTPADSPMLVNVNVAVKSSDLATYDFTTGAGIDKWAYRYQTDAKPPATNDPDIEFATSTKINKDQYVKISTDNRKMQSDSTDTVGHYSAHRFVFDIAQPVDDILTIEVQWNGKGANANRTVLQGATLYIWNGEGYEELASTTSNKRVYLSAELTEGFGSYIANGYMTVLVEQNSAQTVKGKRSLVSKLSTDYVKVDITHT